MKTVKDLLNLLKISFFLQVSICIGNILVLLMEHTLLDKQLQIKPQESDIIV